jgi:hypothetical protein
MANIYQYTNRVLVMTEGIGAVVETKNVPGWIGRARTLQEAVVNPHVWVLVLWDKNKMTVLGPANTTTKWKFYRIGTEYKPPGDMCAIRLTDLLNLADVNLPAGLPAVNIVDGATTSPSDVTRRALRMALVRRNRPMQYTGLRRSMYLRTSSKPADLVYSITGIFKLQINPFRKNPDPRYVFSDLARKIATMPGVVPYWLTIGGVTCSTDVTGDRNSRIVLKFPHHDAGEGLTRPRWSLGPPPRLPGSAIMWMKCSGPSRRSTSTSCRSRTRTSSRPSS